MKNYFFIVGCGRSGTTLLQQALNRHSMIAIPPETAFFTFLGLSRRAQEDHHRRINADLQINLPLAPHRIHRTGESRALYEKMAQLYLKKVNRPDITHFGEKSPEHQRRLDRIMEIFPQAKILLIYRDGRDVACSLRKLPWMSADLYVNFRLWLYYYRLQQRVEQSKELNLLSIKYESLVTNPETELRRVLEFLGLPYEQEVPSGYGNVEGVPAWESPWKSRALNPISSARIGTWRGELSFEQVKILETWGGVALKTLGYQLATNGKNRLPWWLVPHVYAKGLVWLARRPRFGSHKALNRDV